MQNLQTIFIVFFYYFFVYLAQPVLAFPHPRKLMLVVIKMEDAAARNVCKLGYEGPVNFALHFDGANHVVR